jgi:hypothetical protein
MRILVDIVLVLTIFGNLVARSLAQEDPRIRIDVKHSVPGLPPGAVAELSRIAGEYRKADQPANDAMVRAIALRDAGDLTGAVEEARKALTLSVKTGGRTFHPEAYQLLGELALRQNRIDDAFREFKLWTIERDSQKGLPTLSPFGHLSNDACVALNNALAYCQRGNFQLALKYYKGQDTPAFPSPYLNMFKAEEGPGTQTLAGLQATILLQIAYNPNSDTRTEKESDRLLLAAAHLAPNNVMAAYACAKMFMYKSKLAEQLPYWRVVAANGKGRVAEEAKYNVENVSYALAHPYVDKKLTKDL